MDELEEYKDIYGDEEDEDFNDEPYAYGGE